MNLDKKTLITTLIILVAVFFVWQISFTGNLAKLGTKDYGLKPRLTPIDDGGGIVTTTTLLNDIPTFNPNKLNYGTLSAYSPGKNLTTNYSSSQGFWPGGVYSHYIIGRDATEFRIVATNFPQHGSGYVKIQFRPNINKINASGTYNFTATYVQNGEIAPGTARGYFIPLYGIGYTTTTTLPQNYLATFEVEPPNGIISLNEGEYKYVSCDGLTKKFIFVSDYNVQDAYIKIDSVIAVLTKGITETINGCTITLLSMELI